MKAGHRSGALFPERLGNQSLFVQLGKSPLTDIDQCTAMSAFGPSRTCRFALHMSASDPERTSRVHCEVSATDVLASDVSIMTFSNASLSGSLVACNYRLRRLDWMTRGARFPMVLAMLAANFRSCVDP